MKVNTQGSSSAKRNTKHISRILIPPYMGVVPNRRPLTASHGMLLIQSLGGWPRLPVQEATRLPDCLNIFKARTNKAKAPPSPGWPERAASPDHTCQGTAAAKPHMEKSFYRNAGRMKAGCTAKTRVLITSNPDGIACGKMSWTLDHSNMFDKLSCSRYACLILLEKDVKAVST